MVLERGEMVREFKLKVEFDDKVRNIENLIKEQS